MRTTAPARLFPASPVERAEIDGTVCETPDTLRIDASATRRSWEAFVDSRCAILERETAYVRQSGARLIVADIPFLAGEIAAAAGVPCVGISNFTWNWILEPFLCGDARGRRILGILESGYARMREYWRLPFCHQDSLSMFPAVLETPLVAPRAGPGLHELRATLHARFPRVVLISFRGRISAGALTRAAAESPDTLFLAPGAIHADGIANAAPVDFDSTPFQDLAESSDLVVAKLGYGVVSSCVAGKVRLLHAPREGFREDAITSSEASRFTALRQIPISDFEAGMWRRHIDALLAQPEPTGRLPAGGASVCAKRIERWLE